VALLVACQAVQSPAPPASHLNINPSANATATTGGSSAADSTTTTYTIKRDSLQQSLQLQGRVAPTRSAQLTLRGGGTVTEVSVQPGQAVKQGDVLAQFAADDQTLQAARQNATIAELAYEGEQNKLDQLQSGAPKDTVDQAQAVVARDRAAISQLQQQQAAAQSATDRAQQAAGVAQSVADRKVQLAQVALQSAEDTLAAAQDAAQQADDDTKAAESQRQSSAASAVDAARQAVTSADRANQEANIKLSQAKMMWSTTRASQVLETQQFKVGQDTDAVRDAQTADKAAQTGTAAQATAADLAFASAKRALEADSLELQHDKINLDASRTVDDAAVQTAMLDAQSSQDALSQAQAALQQAQQKQQTMNQQPLTASSGQSIQLTPAAAQAAIKQAQHAVDTAALNLQDAQAAADQAAQAVADGAGPDTTANTPSAPDPQAMDAAQAQLSADQSKLASLQAGTSSADIAREQARVTLLHDQATAAAQAAQPVMTLSAPFDGTVSDVGISAGQTIAPGMASEGGLTTASAALAGQNSQGEPVAIRIVAAGNTSIVADASESDIAHLSAGEPVDVSFPGLGGQTLTASIDQIASTPTVKDGSTTYPIQINLPSVPPNLRIGMTAQVVVSSSTGDQVLIAPRAAIHTVGGQSTVTRLDTNGQTQDVPVQLGRSSGGNVELVGGIQEGDKIVMFVPTPLVAAQPPAPNQP
jgi:macrolide-specific efflux system membrane fusion protein